MKAKRSEEGQNMVSYALLIAVVAFGVTIGMSSTASGISNSYKQIAGELSSVTSSPAVPAPPAKSPKTPKAPKTPKTPKPPKG